MSETQPPLQTTAVILAAGLGTRMKSSRPKAAHEIAGCPMLRFLLNTVEKVFDRAVVVIGPGMQELADLAAPHQVVVQHERLGTAHAALQAEALFGEGDVAVLYADNPLISAETMRLLLQDRARKGTDISLLAMRPADPARYGRVIEQEGRVTKIVEWADATEEERAVTLCNAGVLCARAEMFRTWLKQVGNDNAKKEFYLGDVIAIAAREGRLASAVEAPEEDLLGVNSCLELARAEAVVQKRLRRNLLENGVMMQAPETVFVSFDTEIAPGVVIAPHVVFGPGVVIQEEVEIYSFSHLEHCEIGRGSTIGPHARIRSGCKTGKNTRIGNFVEVKATTIGDGTKVGHLTYLGDAEVGEETNIGAGTVTCNYDGKNKHKTRIGRNVFVGSSSIFVAPITIGDGALIAAGSVITKNVSAQSMAFGRAHQIEKPGRGAAFFANLERKSH